MSTKSIQSIHDLLSLSGKTALITGGGGYIGRAIGYAFAELGANVVCLDKDGQAVQQVIEELNKDFSNSHMAIEADMMDDTFLRSVPDKVVKAVGSLDILVNNAAFTGDTGLTGWGVPFAKQSIDAWKAAIDVNLTSVFSLCQASATHLGKTGKGSIINVASIYGVVGPDNALYEGTEMGNPSAYGASKGGLIQFTRYLATELAPNIRANSISPGGVWRDQPSAFVERYIKRTPLGRMATEQDMIGTAVYLASDLSEYVTGQNILVDGGWTAW